jgi:hypothetical protein
MSWYLQLRAHIWTSAKDKLTCSVTTEHVIAELNFFFRRRLYGRRYEFCPELALVFVLSNNCVTPLRHCLVTTHKPTADPRNGQRIKDLRYNDYTLLQLCVTSEGETHH